MSCILCKRDFCDRDNVVKIVKATVVGTEECLSYQGGGDEEAAHVDCLVKVMGFFDKSIPAYVPEIHDSPIERTNILEFLES